MAEPWVEEETPKNIRNKAQALLDEVKAKRAKRKYKMVKVDDKTYKEVPI